MEKINLQQKFALFSEHWTPKMVGAMNEFAVKIVKVKDEAENIEIVLQDFTEFSRLVWSGKIVMNSLYVATLGFASHFMAQNKL
jgi:hypothetical protein